MPDREKVIASLDNALVQMHGCGRYTPEDVDELETAAWKALELLKEQDHVPQKMWNALYAEEDRLEKKFVGTDEHDNWFTVYRPWLQRGFEIGLGVIAKQEGR